MGVAVKPEVTLTDDTGDVEYTLIMAVFRKGGQHDGHYFMAAPTADQQWTVYDSHTMYDPMTLPDLKKTWGKYAHAVIYKCKLWPAQDDWKLLNPTAVMHRPALPIRCALVVSHMQRTARSSTQLLCQ